MTSSSPPSGSNRSKRKGPDPISAGFGGVSWCWRLYHPRSTCLSACTLSSCTIPPQMSPEVPSGYPVPSTYPGILVQIRIRNQTGGIWNFLKFIRSQQISSGGWIPTGGSGSATWQPRGVANKFYIDVLPTVGTQTGKISEQVGDAHALAVKY